MIFFLSKEWVPAFRLAMPDKLGIRCSGRPTTRPARMENETNIAFEIGSPVDGWWSDGWWEGVVTGIGGSGDGDLQVFISGKFIFEFIFSEPNHCNLSS